MFEDIYYNDNYDEHQNEYVYLQDEPEPEPEPNTFIRIIGEAALKGFVTYSVTVMCSHILFDRK